MKAVLCPVCNGEGSEWSRTEVKGGYPDKVYMKFCHGCNGKGWVEVREDIPYVVGGLPQPFIDPNKCPACGGDRNSPARTGCPKGSHYGPYS